jgi:CRP/FNR family transcriptional regulator
VRLPKLFLDLLERHPALTINMLKGFARHLRRFSQLVDNLSLKEVPGRLASYLLTLSERTGNVDQVELDLNKGQLAARLGTVPEPLSRVFYRLSQQGILEVEGSTVTLLDRERLKRLVEG